MAEKPTSRTPETLSVELNEAFERLEKSTPTLADEDDYRDTDSAPGGNGPLPFVSMLLALIAIGLASYAVFMFHTMPAPVVSGSIAGPDPRLDVVEVQLGDVQSRLSAVQGRMDELAGNSGSLTPETLAGVEARLDAAIAGVRAEMGTSSQDWLMAEVEYLIRLGNQRVAMERDAAGALALFRAADDIVRNAEGVAAFELRRTLAADVAALDAVDSVDVDGIFVRLAALVSQVDRLRQVEPHFTPTEVVSEAAPPAGADAWSRISAGFVRIGTRLASLVDYRSDGERISPVLPPKEEYYLRQNLVLKIQMAQLGLLREDQAVYDASLAEARSWIARHFDPVDAATTSMVRTLDELSRVRVAPVLPDVSDSLREVRKLQRSFHQEAPRDE
ncbi:MAG: uroporphyrinogen-III C-methyltransferase [Pseudomonadota bacterium]